VTAEAGRKAGGASVGREGELSDDVVLGLPKPKRVKVGAEACGYLLLGQWPCLLPKQHEPPHRARTVSGTKLEEYTREDFYR
jgi:hypothetical protein